MSSNPSLREEISDSSEQTVLRRIVKSRWTFFGLQFLDLATTLAAFHYGGFEANPLVADLTRHFGQFRGVVTSKLIALCIALGVKRLVWVINLFYAAIVCWNVIVLVGLSAKPH